MQILVWNIMKKKYCDCNNITFPMTAAPFFLQHAIFYSFGNTRVAF